MKLALSHMPLERDASCAECYPHRARSFLRRALIPEAIQTVQGIPLDVPRCRKASAE